MPTRNTLEKKKMVGISSSAQQCFSRQAVTAGDREEFTNKHYVEKPKCRLKNIGFNPIYGQSSSWNILYIIILDGRRGGKKESSVGNLRARDRQRTPHNDRCRRAAVLLFSAERRYILYLSRSLGPPTLRNLPPVIYRPRIYYNISYNIIYRHHI